jgi:hypothetical protein
MFPELRSDQIGRVAEKIKGYFTVSQVKAKDLYDQH